MTNTAPALFSIVNMPDSGKAEDLPSPASGPYFVLTAKGYMVMRNMHWGEVLVPVDKIDTLPAVGSFIRYDIKFPAKLLGQAYSFFKAIYESKKSEAMVDITWSTDKGYRLFVPPQKASYGGVEAKRNLEHYQGQMVGTIHSHCNFDAYHSGTDQHDADGHDGLHITIGDVMKQKPSIAIMVSASKQKWNFELSDITDGPLELVDHPKWWERFVNEPETHNRGRHISTWTKPGASNIVDDVMTDEQWREFVAARSKPTTITGPTRDNPVVISGAPKSTLEMLAADFQGYFSGDDFQQMAAASYYLDEVRSLLEAIGVEVEFKFTPLIGTTADPNDNDPTIPIPF